MKGAPPAYNIGAFTPERSTALSPDGPAEGGADIFARRIEWLEESEERGGAEQGEEEPGCVQQTAAR